MDQAKMSAISSSAGRIIDKQRDAIRKLERENHELKHELKHERRLLWMAVGLMVAAIVFFSAAAQAEKADLEMRYPEGFAEMSSVLVDYLVCTEDRPDLGPEVYPFLEALVWAGWPIIGKDDIIPFLAFRVVTAPPTSRPCWVTERMLLGEET